MSVHKDYMAHQSTGDVREVYEGFNWLAFLFTPIWLFYHGLIGYALFFVVISIVSLFAYGIPALIYSIVAGFQGNEWVYRDLIERGYILRDQEN